MEAPVVDERTLKRRQAAQTAREQKIQQMGKENYDQMRRDEERERRLRQKTQREAAAAAAEAQEENEGGETAPADDPDALRAAIDAERQRAETQRETMQAVP